jgi:CelD/BcsL family acetyltransferase involved in cellulose biosynthesis
VIEVRCFHSLADAQPFRDAMNALNLASARPDPFSTFEFYDHHLRIAAPIPAAAHPCLWLLLAFSGDRLIGYLALKLCRFRVLGLPAAKLDLLTAFKADRPHLVVAADDVAAVRAAIYAYIFSRKKEWSLLELTQQDATSALLPLPREATSRGCASQQWPNMATGAIAVRWPSLAAYFSALSKKFRSDLRRQMRTLLAAGEAELLTSSDPQVFAPLFELYRSVEARSWKARTDAAFAGRNQWTPYYTGLMDGRQPMRVAIQMLLLDGVPIAGLITGAFDKGLYALHTVYDERFSRLAPGSALLLMGMRLAVEGGYRFFDLLQGFGYYKTRWLAQMTETHSLQIYRIGSPFYWRRVLGDAKRRWFGAAVTDETPLANPSRRAVATDALAARTPVASSAEHAHYAALIAQVKHGRGEFLSSLQLAAALPFAATLPAAVPKVQPRTSKAPANPRASTGYSASGTMVMPATALD